VGLPADEKCFTIYSAVLTQYFRVCKTDGETYVQADGFDIAELRSA